VKAGSRDKEGGIRKCNGGVEVRKRKKEVEESQSQASTSAFKGVLAPVFNTTNK